MKIIDALKVTGFEFKDSSDLLFVHLTSAKTVTEDNTTTLIGTDCLYAEDTATSKDVWTELDGVTVYGRVIEVDDADNIPENCVCYGMLIRKLEGVNQFGVAYSMHNTETGEESWYVYEAKEK